MPYRLNTHVILVRHGRSTFNEQGRYQGSSDASVLTEIGQETARQVGILLRRSPIDAVYVSPLKRAQQTLQEILNQIKPSWHPRSIQVHPCLREIDLPAWEGLPFQQVKTHFADDYHCWKQRPHEFQMEAGKEQTVALSSPSQKVMATAPAQSQFFPVLDLYQRAQLFWQEILPRHRRQILLIVSHGGTNHALMSTALSLSANHHHCLQQSNSGVNLLNFRAGSPRLAQLQALNLTSHLGETLPKLKEGKQGLRLLLLAMENPNPQQIETFANYLKAVPIHFSVKSDPLIDPLLSRTPSQAFTQQLLRHHPKIVHLQVKQDDLLQQWLCRNDHNAFPDLMTGILVASPSDVQSFLGQAIGLSSDQHWHLQVYPNTFSVLHYPLEHRPILQAMNLSPLNHALSIDSSSGP
jgi:probable phosphoglycerate mutase